MQVSSEICFLTPQEWYCGIQDLSSANFVELQIKNIKLHIVTDIKVTFNSMLGFRISIFGWGDGYFYISKKILQLLAECVRHTIL